MYQSGYQPSPANFSKVLSSVFIVALSTCDEAEDRPVSDTRPFPEIYARESPSITLMKHILLGLKLI